MKFFLFFAIALAAHPVFAQSKTETEILNLSGKIFRWEVENKIDSLAGLLSDKFKVVTSRGDIQSKEQYLLPLHNGTVTHDSITVEQNTVNVVDKTAVVMGKGWFHLTVSGNKVHRHLSYMEVFVKDKKTWKLLALYASTLPE